MMMEALGRQAPARDGDWSTTRSQLLERMRTSYRQIERLAPDSNGTPIPLVLEHQRSVVQIRLNLALVAPGAELESRLDFDPCLARTCLDDEAVTELSQWLAQKVDGKRRGDANVIGSATMPRFIEGVEAIRATYGVSSGYREWRQRWFELDRYVAEPARHDLVTGLAAPARLTGDV
jgi:hypothetical protein